MTNFLKWLALGLALIALDFALGHFFPGWRAFSFMAKVVFLMFILPIAALVGLFATRKS